MIETSELSLNEPCAIDEACAAGEQSIMRWKTLIEGWPFMAVLVAAALVACVLAPWLNLVLLPLLAFTISFFRDPERELPGDESYAVSAADGRVTDVGLVPHPLEANGGEMLCVGVFLSIFDVHVNRSPLSGRIISSVEEAGEFLDARHPEASRRNARRTWVFEGGQGAFIVRQITGAVARRIVAWAREGENMHRGARFGMIRFGSRTEVYLPAAFEPLVKPGDRVLGGKSLIARRLTPTENPPRSQA